MTTRFRLLVLTCALGLAVPATALAGGVHVQGPFPAAPHRQTNAPIPPMRHPNPQAYVLAERQAAAQALLENPVQAPSLASPAPRAVVSGSLNQPGLAATPTGANSGTPPDSTGAVGPNNYVEFVNSTIAVYSKSDLTTPISTPAPADTFVGQSGDNVFDPQVQYDSQADRWFYLADDCSATLPATGDCSLGDYLAFGFSKTSDPSDLVNGWCRYRVASEIPGQPTTADYFDDYPKLGHDDNHLIFGTNVFNTTSFISARIWVVDKTAMTAPGGTCPAMPAAHYFAGSASSPTEDSTSLSAKPLKDSANKQIATPVPADTMDASTNGYVVAAEDPSSTSIMAWHVTGPGATPTLVADGDITVSSFAQPSNVPQPGTTDKLDASDTRLTQAVALTDPDAGAEAVWTQHTINGPGSRSVVRWYELIPSTATERQEGTISNSANWVFNGAIAPSREGNEAAIDYNVGGSSQVVQVRAQSRPASLALGQMNGEVTLATSKDIDQDFSCPSVPQPPGSPTPTSCRWGDYAGASTDPSVDHAVWGSNQWNGTADGAHDAQWATQNFALIVNAVPTAAFSASPNPASTGQPVNFDASGSSDPGGGGITSYAWDFGDGSSGAGVTTSHAYGAAGTYTVQLTVTNAEGFSASTTHSVTVNAPAPTPAPAPAPAPSASTTTSPSAPPPATTTTATPTGTTSAVTPPAKLTLAVKFPRVIRSAVLQKKGLAGTVRCSAACRLTVTISLPAKVAKRLHTKAKIASITVRLRAGQRKSIRIRLTRAALKAFKRPALATLLKRGSVRLSLKFSGITPDGRRAVLTKRLTLRR